VKSLRICHHLKMLPIFLAASLFYLTYLNSAGPSSLKIMADDILISMAFESNKDLLTAINGLFSSGPRTRKVILMYIYSILIRQNVIVFIANSEGLTLSNSNREQSNCSLFLPQDFFTKFGSNISNQLNGFSVCYSLLADFLHLSIVRGSRPVEITSWTAYDHISLA
jgi:hypothetical protein